jgi:hypothetical protein
MRFKKLQITNHAILRWKERISPVYHTEEDIQQVLRVARLIKKKELLPFSTARVVNTIYAKYQEALFVLQPLSIDEYVLITIITKSENYICRFSEIKSKRKIKFFGILSDEDKKIKKRIPTRIKKVNLDELIE